MTLLLLLAEVLLAAERTTYNSMRQVTRTPRTPMVNGNPLTFERAPSHESAVELLQRSNPGHEASDSDGETLQHISDVTLESDGEEADGRVRKRATDCVLNLWGPTADHHLTHHRGRHAAQSALDARNVLMQRRQIALLEEIVNRLRNQAPNQGLPIAMPGPMPTLPPTPEGDDEDLEVGDLAAGVGLGDATEIGRRLYNEPHHYQLLCVFAVATWLIGGGMLEACWADAARVTNMHCGFANNTDEAAKFMPLLGEMFLTPLGRSLVLGNNTFVDQINQRFAQDWDYHNCWNMEYDANLWQGITTAILNSTGLTALCVMLITAVVRGWDVWMLP